MKRGHRGLTLPQGWKKASGHLHICEGQSDVAAAISSGMRAIGRPGISAGFGDLVALLQGRQDELIVVADNDPEGQGLLGANKLAKKLADSLQQYVTVMVPPARFKDLRQFLIESPS